MVAHVFLHWVSLSSLKHSTYLISLVLFIHWNFEIQSLFSLWVSFLNFVEPSLGFNIDQFQGNVGNYSMKKIEVFFLQVAQMSSSKFVDLNQWQNCCNGVILFLIHSIRSLFFMQVAQIYPYHDLIMHVELWFWMIKGFTLDLM